MENKNWYHREGHTPHFQGHVMDEETGASVAVTYNDEGGEHARLIAQAPAMLEACRMALDDLIQTVNYDEGDPQTLATVATLEAVIAAASNP